MRVRTHATKSTTTVDGSIATTLAEHQGVTALVLNIIGQRAESGAFMVANATLSLAEAQDLANTINAALASHTTTLAVQALKIPAKPFAVAATATYTGEERAHHVSGMVRPLVRLDKIPDFDKLVRFRDEVLYYRQDEYGEGSLCRRIQAVYRTTGRVVRTCTAPESTQGLLVRPVNDPMEGLVATPDGIVAWVSKEPVQ